jgi:hypothetical protein
VATVRIGGSKQDDESNYCSNCGTKLFNKRMNRSREKHDYGEADQPSRSVADVISSHRKALALDLGVPEHAIEILIRA